MSSQDTRNRATHAERGGHIAMRFLDALAPIFVEESESLRAAMPLLRGYRQETLEQYEMYRANPADRALARTEHAELAVWDALLQMVQEYIDASERQQERVL
jgi:hypothetical protein